jgi:hypothetical protein
MALEFSFMPRAGAVMRITPTARLSTSPYGA